MNKKRLLLKKFIKELVKEIMQEDAYLNDPLIPTDKVGGNNVMSYTHGQRESTQVTNGDRSKIDQRYWTM